MASFSASPRWERVAWAVTRGNDYVFGGWMQPKPSRKSMWRCRKERQQNSHAQSRSGDGSMDTPAPPVRDWSLLPLDMLSLVFVRLSAIDILMGAGLACGSWLDAAKVPDVWRVVHMDDYETAFAFSMQYSHMLRTMAKVAVDRSDGQLRVFAGFRFVTEEVLKYIVERSPSLTTLRLTSCTSTLFSARVVDVIRESPLRELRSLELDNVYVTVDKLTAVLENCPALEVLTVCNCYGMDEEDEHILRANSVRIKNLTFECDDDIREYKCCSSCGY